MRDLVWFVLLLSCGALFSGIGVYAWRRKKPMWFRAGIAVRETEIADVRAYNHANGVMWGVYSLVYWAAALAGLWSSTISLILIAAGCVVGLPLLAAVHKRIYQKYKAP